MQRPLFLVVGIVLLALMLGFAFFLNSLIQKKPETREPFRLVVKKLILPESILLGVGLLIIVALLIFYPANEASARDGWITFTVMWTLFIMVMLFNIRGARYLTNIEKDAAG